MDFGASKTCLRTDGKLRELVDSIKLCILDTVTLREELQNEANRYTKMQEEMR